MVNSIPKKIIETLNQKNDSDLGRVVELALTDTELLRTLLDGQVLKNETYRYNCFKVLHRISEDCPFVLYPHWDYFVDLLNSENAYHKIASIEIIANLTQVDQENRFKTIFDQFFRLLDARSMIVAITIAQNAGKIAKSKPGLQEKITKILFNIDKTHYEQDRKDLIKAGAIQSFEVYFDRYPKKEKIIAFVEQLKNCRSPKTRKIASHFLAKYSI